MDLLCESCSRPLWLPAENDEDLRIDWSADSVPGSWFEHPDGGGITMAAWNA